ncbi:glycoside hydrolase family 92 protein [Nibribacter ruber]|uniref:Glycoside hydrolase family 92 protein n=1 Tax=Nibribacter ruber TaxID=2698458 RepID=A0A6P1P1G2_9BACT|nr:GH92 family glycosyl hydrolase [Nibribacter ruber]QHL87593.1 glycoside hydrolase family 92 protein [Nibribacter ruber]
MQIHSLKISALGVLVTMGLVAGCALQRQGGNDKEKTGVDAVDPFIGTGGHGHTYPGASVPFGMVQASPDNGTQGWDWCSGYHYSDSLIAGFSQTHLSGTGIGDLVDVSLMPQYVSDLQKNPRQKFSHKNETATPGLYTVQLDNHIAVALTTTERVALHQYQFPADSAKGVMLDLGFAINWDKPTETNLTVVNDTLVTGLRKSSGWARQQWVYFAAVFSEPIQKVDVYDSLQKVSGRQIKGRKVKALFTFKKGKAPLLVKVSISSASEKGALQNIQKELPGWGFTQVAQKARKQWTSEMDKIEASFIEPGMSTIFYSALYHSALAPTLFSDVQGQYKGAKDSVTTVPFQRYSTFSLWDTFRAAHPLYTITQQDRVPDMMHSLLQGFKEHKLLPVWELSGNETNTMTGYHAVPVLADALLKGFLPDKAEEIYAAMEASAAQNVRGTDFYRTYGYIPADKDGWSVTKTLEYAYDDWCIAQVAKKLGKQADYQKYLKRAASYRALFDKQMLFMRGKKADGSWVTPFNPFYSEHGFEGAYIEGTTWQHSWFVPHDVQGLINLFGSERAFVQHIDSTFNASSKMEGENVSPDISGLIGQYAHGNEPSHHIAYLYNYAGQPWKTQEKVRQILTTMYSAQPDGLAGNEDCGQMSAWYVFSAMGFYPVNPADGKYVLGSPLVKQAKINVGRGRYFEVEAKNNNTQNKYIQAVSLNGQPLQRSYITHQEVMAGGKLTFTMGSQPNKTWASQETQRPPSMTAK